MTDQKNCASATAPPRSIMTWLVPTDTAASPGVVLLVPVERGEVVVIDAGVFELVGTGPDVLRDGVKLALRTKMETSGLT